MKSFILILAALLVCVSVAPVHAGGHCCVVQQQAVAFAPVAVYAPPVAFAPVYAPAAQAAVVQSAPIYYAPQAFAQARSFRGANAQAQAFGGASAQAQAVGGGRSFAFSRVGAPAPIRNGLAILGAAIAARRNSQVSIAISR